MLTDQQLLIIIVYNHIWSISLNEHARLSSLNTIFELEHMKQLTIEQEKQNCIQKELIWKKKHECIQYQQ